MWRGCVVMIVMSSVRLVSMCIAVRRGNGVGE